MTINSSTIGAANPTVTSLSSTQGLVTGGATLTVTGIRFRGWTSTTVNFVATNATTNIVLAGIDPTVAAGSTTSLSVTIPPTTTQTSFYVIVSTPDGSSPAGSPGHVHLPAGGPDSHRYHDQFRSSNRFWPPVARR